MTLEKLVKNTARSICIQLDVFDALAGYEHNVTADELDSLHAEVFQAALDRQRKEKERRS